jgi:hypothetical protein
MKDTSQAVRLLNDTFRRTFRGGRVVVTASLSDRADLSEIIAKVKAFEDFSQDNDPYGEHDFGAFTHAGDTLFWKIDYYDSDLSEGSLDPSDPDVTARVLTVMLAWEY